MKRKFLLLGSFLASAALPLAVLSCSPSQQSEVTSTFGSYAKEGIYPIRYNSIFQLRRGQTDTSFSSGSWTAGPEITTLGLLFRYEPEGKAEFHEQVELAENKIDQVTKTYVTKPSTSKWKLEYAKAIKIVVNGQEIVYDNDKVDPLGGPTIDGKYYPSSVVPLTSSDVKSINHPEFFKNLDKASSVKIEVDESSHWIDANGKKTKYNVVARDFYYGILRTYLSNDTAYRWNNGGNAELDTAAKSIIPNSESMYKKEATYTNKYLYNLYNIDFDKLIKEDEFIKNEDGKNYLVFNKKDASKDVSFSEFFKGILYGNYEFVPAPSQYIDEKNNDLASLKGFALANESEEASVKEKISAANGLTKQTGIYWYGLTNNATLYAGRYYYKGYNANELSEKWLLNENYIDQEYANNPARIKVIESVYKTQTVEAGAFKVEDFNSFKAGTTAAISFSQLDPKTQSLIKSKKDVFGLTKTQSRQTKNTVGYFFGSLVPNSAHNPKDTAEYVNDAYTRLVWGASLADVKAGRAQNTLKHATTGAAAEFRNILTAVINWDHSAKEASSPEQVYAWLSGAAPDLKIENSPTIQGNTPRQNVDAMNELFVVAKETNQRLDLGGNLGSELWQSENDTVGKQAKDKYKSAAYDVLKARFKKLVDEFYENNSDLASDPKNSKIVITVLSRFINLNAKVALAAEQQVAVLNSLYPEKFEVKYSIIKDREQLLSYYINNPAPTKIVGWSADYELINASLDGKSWNFQLLPVLATIATDEAYKAKLALAYPTLVKAAEKLQQYITENNLKLSIPLDVWGKLANKYLYDFSDYLGNYKVKEGTENGQIELVEIDSNSDSTNYISAGDLSSQFLLWLNTNAQNALSKEDLIKLTSEATNLVGLLVNPHLGVLQEAISNRLVNPNYIVPETDLPFDDYSSFLVKK
ncbi:OppA family ABC transporter substrate-binding lipoprotein [Mycoplasmopsis edwardii]|nr:hypothetical protein [Mycoplasmopsis edwardii]